MKKLSGVYKNDNFYFHASYSGRWYVSVRDKYHYHLVGKFFDNNFEMLKYFEKEKAVKIKL